MSETAISRFTISKPFALRTFRLRLFLLTLVSLKFPEVFRLTSRFCGVVVLGSLPPRIRELYGLRWNPAQAVAFRAAVGGLRSSRPLVPKRVRTGSNAFHFDLVARTEKARAARGEEIPGALSPAS